MNNILTDKNESVDNLLQVLKSDDSTPVNDKEIYKAQSENINNPQSPGITTDFDDELFPDFKSTASESGRYRDDF